MQKSGFPDVTSQRVSVIDGLRGVAISAVLVEHFVRTPLLNPASGSLAFYLSKALGLAWSGVDLFFVLSGYLITSILLRARGAGNYFRVFYARRALRILPLYAVVLGLTAAGRAGGLEASLPWLLGGQPLWPGFYTFTQNVTMALAGEWQPYSLGVTWSLAVEEQFYLLLPAAVALCSPRGLARLAGALIVLAVLLRLTLPISDFMEYVLLPTRMDALFGGVLVAVLTATPSGRARVAPYRRWVALGAAGAWSAAYLLRVYGPKSYLLLAVSYALLLLYLVSFPQTRLRRVFEWKPFVRLGLLCYGLYLLHRPVQGLIAYCVTGRDMPRLNSSMTLLAMILGVVLTYGLAELSWRYLEEPALRIGKRLKYRFVPHREAIAAGMG